MNKVPRRYRRLTQRERDLINWRNGFGLDLIDSLELMKRMYEQERARSRELLDRLYPDSDKEA